MCEPLQRVDIVRFSDLRGMLYI
ncbi:hypothetical protein CBM2587_B60292 [Cupriavidus taiwanensis]|uniref:Uncharacterized protein n=1 Tax=Cupriavidus taiwanensis TaxID=164546 RepID=A0A975X9Y9_9BURK|nr:hypothetical protein CBM2587_B60292 [Cupriavidus taiwanensis]